jgi:hypothetical protein
LLDNKPDDPSNLQNVENLPEELHTIPVDLKHHWSILDQTKAEFAKSGRSGIVLYREEDAAYKERLKKFLAKFGFKWETGKPYLVIQHDTQSKELFDLVTKAGLRAELIQPK